MRRVAYALAFVFSLLYSVSGLAAAVFETVVGDVKAGPSATQLAAASVGERVDPGAVVATGKGGLALLRFDDGQAVAVAENTEFKVAEYTYVPNDPKQDRSVFDLVKGVLRSVSGALAHRSPQNFALRIPQATIGVRGTDFMAGLANQGYMQVTQGAISVTNAAGSVTFTAGTTATVASATTLATSIAASALPASIASSFSQLGSLTIAGAAGAGAGAGAGAASGAAAGGITVGAVSAVAAAVAAAVAVSSSTSTPGTTSTTGTTGTTGTTAAQ